MKLEFSLDGNNCFLNDGGYVKLLPDTLYRDAPADVVKALTERVRNGEDWRELVRNEIQPNNPWLAKIILNENRNDFLSLIPEFEDGFLALDVGSGWGQHTIEISKHGKVCSVEPSPERFDFMRAICSQEGSDQNCFYINSVIKDLANNDRCIISTKIKE